LIPGTRPADSRVAAYTFVPPDGVGVGADSPPPCVTVVGGPVVPAVSSEHAPAVANRRATVVATGDRRLEDLMNNADIALPVCPSSG
jgi:hypothetical protein